MEIACDSHIDFREAHDLRTHDVESINDSQAILDNVSCAQSDRHRWVNLYR